MGIILYLALAVLTLLVIAFVVFDIKYQRQLKADNEKEIEQLNQEIKRKNDRIRAYEHTIAEYEEAIKNYAYACEIWEQAANLFMPVEEELSEEEDFAENKPSSPKKLLN